MNKRVIFILLCMLLAFSCSKKEPAPSQPQAQPASEPKQAASEPAPEKKPPAQKPVPVRKSTTSLNVISEYTGVLIMAHRKAKDTSVLITLRHLIQTYKALNDRFPRDLDEIKDEMKKDGYEMPKPPRGQEYNYNPETGEIYLYYTPEEKTTP